MESFAIGRLCQGKARAKLSILRARKRRGWHEILGGVRGRLCRSKAPDFKGAKKARLVQNVGRRSW